MKVRCYGQPLNMSKTLLARSFWHPRFCPPSTYRGRNAPELLGAKGPQKSQISSPVHRLSPGVPDPAHSLDRAVLERQRRGDPCTSFTFYSCSSRLAAWLVPERIQRAGKFTRRRGCPSVVSCWRRSLGWASLLPAERSNHQDVM